MTLRADMKSLSEMVRLPRNAKAHDVGAISQSFQRFGFLERVIVNDVTGRLIAGHGRIDTLQRTKAGGGQPPTGIQVKNNEWFVPVDYVSILESEETAAAIALNRTVELGGWDDAKLAEILSDFAAEGDEALEGTGFDTDDLDSLLKSLDPDPGEKKGSIDKYQVVVECDSEGHQAEVFETLVNDGYRCRVKGGEN